MHLHALTFERAGSEWELTSIDPIDAADIKPDDDRIFVAKEHDVDWVSAALESALNKEASR